MSNNGNGKHARFDSNTADGSHAYSSHTNTNRRRSMYLTDPTGQYPIVSTGYQYGYTPRNGKPDPNLDVSRVFENENRGGRRRRKTTKRRKSKFRKQHRKVSRRYR